MQRNMDNVVFSPPSIPLHATSNGWTAQFLQNPRCQQDCHLDHVHHGAAPGDGCIIKQSQIRERILSSPTDNIAALPVGYLQGSNCSLSTFSPSHLPIRAQVESPADSTTENGVLPTVSVSLDQGLIPVPRYQDMAWNSRHAEVDYFSRSPTVYADEDGRFPVVSQVRHNHNEANFVTHIGAHPAQLPHHISITHGHIPLEGRFPDTSPVNAITPYCDGVALDRTFDNSAYSSFALPSLSASILLPDAVGYPLGHLQGDENFSEIGEPSVHHVTAGPTAIPRGSASFHESVNLRHDDTSGSDPYVSSWTASPNPVMPPLQGPYPLGYLAMGNISTSPEWAESSAWLRNQAYPPSYGQTEIVSAPTLPHILPYAPQPSSQSNSNPVGSLRTSPSIPVSPGPSSSSSSVACAHDGTLPIPVGPPLTGYPHTKFVVDSHKEFSGRGRTRACHQVILARSNHGFGQDSPHYARFVIGVYGRVVVGEMKMVDCAVHLLHTTIVQNILPPTMLSRTWGRVSKCAAVGVLWIWKRGSHEKTYSGICGRYIYAVLARRMGIMDIVRTLTPLLLFDDHTQRHLSVTRTTFAILPFMARPPTGSINEFPKAACNMYHTS
ncbi:hypothetical protein F5141DRAFT_624069 [Pisolithus sp. B1]|nr:hypothetical protein F5141DRAFT_624069 [Pisolithus sp. B1]